MGDRVRKFTVRPTFSLRGRTFKGLRGWSGKPTHPPLTDIPVTAYIFAAVFDVVRDVGRDKSWAQGFYRAATYVVIGGRGGVGLHGADRVLGLAPLDREGNAGPPDGGGAARGRC